MTVVIDTSVLVSAAFRDRTPEEVILFVTGQDAFHWIVSDEILAEYREVLSRPKFDLSEKILNQWIEMLESSTIEIDIVPVFLSGNFDDFLNFVIPFSDLMKGDIISIFGTPISETEMQAILVIRHRKRSDFNGDGQVDFPDFLIFVSGFEG